MYTLEMKKKDFDRVLDELNSLRTFRDEIRQALAKSDSVSSGASVVNNACYSSGRPDG